MFNVHRQLLLDFTRKKLFFLESAINIVLYVQELRLIVHQKKLLNTCATKTGQAVLLAWKLI